MSEDSTEVTAPAKDESEKKPTRTYRKRVGGAGEWAVFVNRAFTHLRQQVDPKTSIGRLSLQAEVAASGIAKKRVSSVIRYLYDLKLVERLEKDPGSDHYSYRVDLEHVRINAEDIQMIREIRKQTKSKSRASTAPVEPVVSHPAVTPIPVGDSPQELVNQAFDVMLAPYLARIDELERMLTASVDRLGQEQAEVNRLNLLLDDVRALVCSRPGSQPSEDEVDG